MQTRGERWVQAMGIRLIEIYVVQLKAVLEGRISRLQAANRAEQQSRAASQRNEQTSLEALPGAAISRETLEGRLPLYKWTPSTHTRTGTP